MKKNTPVSDNNKMMLSILCSILLVSMLFDTVKAFLAGGPDAPSVPMLIAVILILGGGTVFAITLAYRTWKSMAAAKNKKDEESTPDPDDGEI